MARINVLWAIDHVCYDGTLHGGGRLYWNVLPQFDSTRFNVIPCLLRASDVVREVLRDSPVPMRILDKGKFDPTTLWTFLSLIRREGIQVMHLHCYGCSSFGRVAGLISGVPSVIHDYDTEVYFPYPSYLSLADRLLAPGTAKALAASPMVKRFMMTKRKIDEDKIRMLFHAVPLEKYDPIPVERIRAVREQLDVPPGAPLTCTVTKLGPQRGNEMLLETAAKVLERLPDTVFLLIYKPTHLHRQPDRRYVPADHENTVQELKRRRQELGLQDRVRFIEQEENVDDLVAASDLFVAPFLSERFSSVGIVEAMALGKPVIATDLGEQREIVRDGANGFLVQPGDVDQLADALHRTLSNPDLLERLSSQARSDAEEYSTRSYARTLEDLYTELAEEDAVQAVGRGTA